MSLSEVHPTTAKNTNLSQLEFAAIVIGTPEIPALNSGRAGSSQPLDPHPFAQLVTLTAVLNLAAAPGVTITNVSASDPSATVSFGALKATITSSTSVAANVTVSTPSGTQPRIIAGGVVLSSNLPDPDPRQHITSFYFDTSSSGSHVALPSNPPNAVIKPVARGK